MTDAEKLRDLAVRLHNSACCDLMESGELNRIADAIEDTQTITVKLVEACRKATKALESIRRNKGVIYDALRAAKLAQGPNTIAGWERNLADAEKLTAELAKKP